MINNFHDKITEMIATLYINVVQYRLKYKNGVKVMKYAFSTEACPDWDFKKIVATAKMLKFDGIEICGIQNELHTPKIKEFTRDNIFQSMTYINGNNLKIPVIATQTCLGDKKNKINLLQEPYECIEIAEKAGIPYIKVSGDFNTEPMVENGIDLFYLLDNMKQVCSYARPKEITVLMETKGIFSDSRFLGRFLNELDCKNAGVLWDINNTYRYSGEPPEQTVGIFKNKIRHIHINDSVLKNGELLYKPLGKGDLPINDVVKALKDMDYREFISLDWPKRTHDEILSADTILPQFLYYMKNITE